MGNGYKEYLDWYSDEIKEYSNHRGCRQLEKEIKSFTKNEQQIIMTQYKFMLKQFDKDNRDTVMKHVVENYPDIISLSDLIKEENAFFKFFWTVYKKDEKKADDIFNKLSFDYKKKEFAFQNEEILIYIIHLKIDCDYNADIFHSDSARKIQDYGYKPSDRFKRRMIPYGFGWYIYGNPKTNFSESCHYFLVFPLIRKNNNINNSKEKSWSKDGYREDLDKGFRSTWEANIARILNYKNLVWQYEEEFIPLDISNSKLKITPNYVPDFVLEDGTIIEVKGFWDARSKKKISLFLEQYPQRKIIIIDCDTYINIEKKYHELISYWEDETTTPTNDIVQIVGITLPDRIVCVSKVNPGDILKIVRESNNEYDSNAIYVMDSDNNKIGYFSKDCNFIYSRKMDMGFKYEIKVEMKGPNVLKCRIKLLNKNE